MQKQLVLPDGSVAEHLGSNIYLYMGKKIRAHEIDIIRNRKNKKKNGNNN